MSEVAVYDPFPLFRAGVLGAVGPGGVDLASRADAERWVQGGGGTLLFTLTATDDARLPLRLMREPRVRFVAVLDSFTVVTAARMFHAGAANVVARNALTSEFREVVDDANAGRVTLTHEVLRAAVAIATEDDRQVGATDEELSWMRSLAAGTTVAVLAEDSQLSERVMYRRLGQLYKRLGVENRTQAIVLARGRGWVSG